MAQVDWSAAVNAPAPSLATRQSLLRARDVALGNVASMADSITRDVNQMIATIANEFNGLECPEAALADALKVCRLLFVAQSICGQLDGTYPCDRYANGN